jgi:predicted nucleic acid-binding protein
VILVDTSVWVDHLRVGDARLRRLLLQDQVLCHPFVIGELACGNIRNRREILHLLETLAQAPVVGQEEVLHLVETRKLQGKGLGWVDVHLLAAALLSGSTLWTTDRALHRAAASMRLATA